MAARAPRSPCPSCGKKGLGNVYPSQSHGPYRQCVYCSAIHPDRESGPNLRFPYKSETSRSDAITEARARAKELTRKTGIAHVHVHDGNSSYLVVQRPRVRK
jgi:hypothetical protein